MNCNFYTPEEVKPFYEEIVTTYQEAFAGEPWYEVSKCADQFNRCIGGLSEVAVSALCDVCLSCPSRPAYEADELIERFEALADSRPTGWYTEQNDNGLTLVAVAWKATPPVIAQEKYADVPEMSQWLEKRCGDKPIIWLDEVFANKKLQASGNLRRFGSMVTGFFEQLGSPNMAFRTINQRMTDATKRDFGNLTEIAERQRDVPDRRDFVIVNKR